MTNVELIDLILNNWIKANEILDEDIFASDMLEKFEELKIEQDEKKAKFSDAYIYVPDEEMIIYMQLGDGSQFLPEDIDEGYESYVDYKCNQLVLDTYEADTTEDDGGIYMYKENILDKFNDLLDCVPDVLDEQFGDRSLKWVLLRRG